MYVSIIGNYIDLSGEGYIFLGPCLLSLRGPPIVIGWSIKKHKVVYVLVSGLHQSHWVAHQSHCVVRLSHWVAHPSHWIIHHGHWVARQSHWVAHRCYRTAHPIHLGGTPWSFNTGGYLWHSNFA
jgi:hypothetical protein